MLTLDTLPVEAVSDRVGVKHQLRLGAGARGGFGLVGRVRCAGGENFLYVFKPRPTGARGRTRPDGNRSATSGLTASGRSGPRGLRLRRRQGGIRRMRGWSSPLAAIVFTATNGVNPALRAPRSRRYFRRAAKAGTGVGHLAGSRVPD